MGVFDSFILQKPVFCPKCKKGKLKEFQTKSLCRLLLSFQQGKPVKTDDFQIEKGKVYCYGYCDICEEEIEGWAVIDDGKFKEIRLK